MSEPFSYVEGMSLDYYKSKRAAFLKHEVKCGHDDNDKCPYCLRNRNEFLAGLDELVKNYASLV